MGKLYLERKAAGICVRCGTRDERTAAGRISCEKCAQDQREWKARRREYMKKRKRCVNCGEMDWRTDEGLTECEACAKKYNNSPARIERTERYKLQQKIIRAERREAGVCTKCGGKRDLEGYLMCSWCLAKQREYIRGYVHGGAILK